MIGERYTLTLRHEMVNPETGERHQLEPPLTICYTMCDPYERCGVIYAVDSMMLQMERELLNRVDGGVKDAAD